MDLKWVLVCCSDGTTQPGVRYRYRKFDTDTDSIFHQAEKFLEACASINPAAAKSPNIAARHTTTRFVLASSSGILPFACFNIAHFIDSKCSYKCSDFLLHIIIRCSYASIIASLEGDCERCFWMVK
ncbi:hypothetical protein M8C21_001760, partial [Ambrosia artemisiifolia]